MNWIRFNGGPIGPSGAFIKTHKLFLIGESWLAWRSKGNRGNVQTGLEDLGFEVKNFAQNGVTLKNFWYKEHMSWEKWEGIQRQDAMVITIGFNQLSDSDMDAKDEAEVRNVVQQALDQSNHVIVVNPNQPLIKYFTERAEWYIQRQRDDLNEPDITANALKRQQLYARRSQTLVNLLKSIQYSHQSLQIVDMQNELTPADIFDDGCHLNHQGATKTANAIAQALKCQRKRGVCGRISAYALNILFATLLLKIVRVLFQRRILHKFAKRL